MKANFGVQQKVKEYWLMFGFVLKVLLVNVYEKITQCILVSVFFVSFEGRF